MLAVTTESGARYLYDTEQERVMRESGPVSEGINYKLVPDAEWNYLTDSSELALGARWNIVFTNGLWRSTTEVVSIEVVD